MIASQFQRFNDKYVLNFYCCTTTWEDQNWQVSQPLFRTLRLPEIPRVSMERVSLLRSRQFSFRPFSFSIHSYFIYQRVKTLRYFLKYRITLKIESYVVWRVRQIICVFANCDISPRIFIDAVNNEVSMKWNILFSYRGIFFRLSAILIRKNQTF